MIGCSHQRESKMFPKGIKNPSEHFHGTSWTYELFPNDTIYNLYSGSVHFEPNSYTDWHSHPSGQILIITEGIGYYQQMGKIKKVIKKGDIVKCPPNVKHWHGASPNHSMTFIHTIPNTENGYLNWSNEVTNNEYFK